MRRAATILVVAALVLMGCSDTGDDDDEGVGEGPALAAGPWAPQKGLPFQEPVQVPAVRDPNVKDVSVTLDVKQRTIQVSGADLTAMPFHDQVTDGAGKKSDAIDGPTLHVSQGGKITVNFINNSGQDSNIHYHGLHVSPKDLSDNVFQVFKTGTTRTSIVDIPANHPVGTYWYHVHMHGNSEPQVNGGLSGMLIVEGLEITLNAEIQNSPQKQFAIREIRTQGGGVVTKATTTVQPTTTAPPAAVTTVLVNGLSEPTLTIKEDEYQLWRFANIGVNMAYHLRLPAALHAWIVGEDGNPVFAEGKLAMVDKSSAVTLALPAGKRFDVLVYSEDVPTTAYTLDNVDATDPTKVLGTLVRVEVEKASAIALAPLSPAAVDTDTAVLPDDGLRTTRLGLPIDMERTFTFSFGVAPEMLIAGEWFDPITHERLGGFDAKPFDPNVTDVTVNLGARERWTIINASPAVHPFHIHVNEFEVELIEKGGQDTGYRAIGTSDVIEVPAATKNVDDLPDIPGRVVLINEYKDFSGHFVFHCHILNHEDRGMMAVIQVVGPGEQPTPPPHDSTGAAHGRIKVG